MSYPLVIPEFDFFHPQLTT